MEILQLKMKKDLLKMSLDYIDKYDIDETESSETESSETESSKWINTRIEYHINKLGITFHSIDKSKQSIESRCKARLYTNRTGQDQCTHQCIKDTSYCHKHSTMLEREGVLRFGDICEEIPQYDLIKQKHGISERIYWEHSDPLQQLQQILDLQKRKVILSTPKLILS